MARRIFVVAALLTLAVGAAVTAFWFSHGSRVRGFAGVLLISLVAVTSLTTINLSLRWLRWQYLVRMLGVQVRTRDSFRIFFATLPAIVTPFYVGELVRGAILSRRTPGAFTAGAIAWLIERVSDVLVIGGLLILTSRRAVIVPLAAIVALGLGYFAARKFLQMRPTRAWMPVVILMAMTTVTWCMPVLALDAAAEAAGFSLSPRAATRAFSSGTLLGGATGVPLGVGVTGSTVIVSLTRAGMRGDAAAEAVAVFRAGTAWFAVAMGVLVFVRSRKRLFTSGEVTSPEHFDSIAAGYDQQIPTHVRDRLLKRKTDITVSFLEAAGIGKGSRGLDVGCGHGWYAMDMARAGYRMSGFDYSAGQVARAAVDAKAAGLDIDFRHLDATNLAYESDSFDFAYSINVLHHITGPGAQEKALAEIVRVLRPGGIFVLHEINVLNPIFELYMGYVFPLIRDIDDGTERWLRPNALPAIRGATWDVNHEYFTFLPDFVPGPALKAFMPVEQRLERSRFRRFSAHFSAVLVKSGQPQDVASEANDQRYSPVS